MVSLVRFAPLASMSQISWPVPFAVPRSNAIREPSGDHAGLSSKPA
jgi:hypothetical protein